MLPLTPDALTASGTDRSEPTVGRLDSLETRFRLLVESVKDYAIFILDPRGIVSTWNSGAERIKGYASDEIIGRHFSTFYPSGDVALCNEELAIADRMGRFEDDGWRIRKDGTRFWANVVITPLRDAGGTLVGFAKVTRDLTARIRAEHDRMELIRREEADRHKDEFLAILSHELRNPLMPLTTVVELIRLRGGRATEREVAILDRQLRHMTRMVADVLNASRAMRDKIELALRTVEIGDVLSSASETASPLIHEGRHKLQLDVPCTGLLVRVDSDRMIQVFGNVLNNAAKYTPREGVIRVEARAEGDKVRIVISDNGQGIPAHLLSNIFDLFVQGDQGLERRGGGLGVGLAVARKIVRDHEGDIFAESDGIGYGSRFVITLPRAETPSSTDLGLGDPPPSKAPSGCRLVLADDNMDAVEMLQELLEQHGHEVHVAFDGPAALELCSRIAPDAVLLDIGLPGMDGYEVARRVRQIPSCKTVPIVAISGYAREEDKARARASGFTFHLAKPIELAQITEILRTL